MNKKLSLNQIKAYRKNFDSHLSSEASMNALTRSKLEDVTMDWETFRKIDHTYSDVISTEMKKVKEENLNELVTGLVDISEEGLDSFGIVKTLDSIGIETIDLNIAMEKKKEMLLSLK